MKQKYRQKGISRIDSRSTHGWYVRGYKNGKTCAKFFSDSKFGSKNEALDAALAYHRDLVCSLEKIPNKERKRIMVMSNTRNKSGVVGVSLIKRVTNTGKVNKYYAATWRPEVGVQKSRIVSIRKYGVKEAFRRAVEWRHRMIRKIHFGQKNSAKQRCK